MSSAMLHYSVADPLRYLRNYGVSKCPVAIINQFSGNPINAPSHSGLMKPPVRRASLMYSGCQRNELPISAPLGLRPVASFLEQVVTSALIIIPPFIDPRLRSGVGKYPNPVSDVRGTNGRRWNTFPFRIIPERGKVPKNSAHRFVSKQTWDVLNKHESRSKFPNNTAEVHPQPTSSILLDSSHKSGGRQILTGESSTDEINGFEFSPIEFCNVSISFHLRPMLRQHLRTERVYFNLPATLHTSALQAKIHTSYTRE